MVKIAALLLLVGSGCHLVEPKGICTNGVWIASIVTATSAVIAAKGQGVSMRWAVISGALAMLLFVELGFWWLLKEIDKRTED